MTSTQKTLQISKHRELGNARRIWRQACQHDSIDTNTTPMFVVFSEGNPFVSKYDAAMHRLFAIQRKLKRAV